MTRSKETRLSMVLTLLLTAILFLSAVISLTGCDDPASCNTDGSSRTCVIDVDINYVDSGIVKNKVLECSKVESLPGNYTEFSVNNIVIFEVETDSIINYRYLGK
jgi:uncharacterized lipoprotein YehR (DUF1307 family)